MPPRFEPILLAAPLASLCFAIGNPATVVALRELPVALVASGRCAIAALCLLFVLRKNLFTVLGSLDRKTLLVLFCSGLALAAHFIFWVAGLAFTSYPAAIGLVAFEPISILVAGALFFEHRITVEQTIGIGLAITGGLVISLGSHVASGGTPHSLLGDFYVFLGVVVYGFYFVGNRVLQKAKDKTHFKVRQEFVDLSFATVIYLVAATAALVFYAGLTAFSAKPLLVHASSTAWLALLLAGVIPTCVGHTLTQIASRRVAPIWVALISPGETLWSLAIGVLYLNAYPSTQEFFGALTILSGALLSTLELRKALARIAR